MAAPVITTPTPGKFGWIINATCSDASGCEELKAAPAAGTAIIVDHITINNGAAGTQSITIGSGEAAGAVETALIGPIAMGLNSSVQWTFPYGMVLTAAKSLTVDSDDTHDLMIFAYGRIV
jgi:hypothetical protein